jgi:hypothetical protein
MPVERSKRTYEQYRQRARDLYERVAVIHGETHGSNILLDEIKIAEHANVQITEDGAFVEAIVWVPKEKFERPEPRTDWSTVVEPTKAEDE